MPNEARPESIQNRKTPHAESHSPCKKMAILRPFHISIFAGAPTDDSSQKESSVVSLVLK